MKNIRSALFISSIFVFCIAPITDVLITVMTHGVGSG